MEELVGAKVTKADLLPINPPTEELAAMREALLEARAAARAAKKEGKKGKAAAAAGAKRPAAEAGAGAAGAAAAPAGGSGGLYAGEAARNGGDAAGAAAAAKKFKAAELMPTHADKKVWESLFTSSRPAEKETYLCRNTAARGMHLS